MTDYYPSISRAIAALDEKSKKARSAIYDRARATLGDQLKKVDPPLSEADVENERLALEDAIDKVEADAVADTSKELEDYGATAKAWGYILLAPIIFVGAVIASVALYSTFGWFATIPLWAAAIIVLLLLIYMK